MEPFILKIIKRSRHHPLLPMRKPKLRLPRNVPGLDTAPLELGSQYQSSLGPFPNWGANSCPWRALGKKQLRAESWPGALPAEFMSCPGWTVWLLYERLSRAQRWNLFPLNDCKCQAARPGCSLRTHPGGWRPGCPQLSMPTDLMVAPNAIRATRRPRRPWFHHSPSNVLSRGPSPSRLRWCWDRGCCSN